MDVVYAKGDPCCFTHLTQMDSAKILRELKDALDAKGIDRIFYVRPVSEGSLHFLERRKIQRGRMENTILALPSITPNPADPHT